MRRGEDSVLGDAAEKDAGRCYGESLGLRRGRGVGKWSALRG